MLSTVNRIIQNNFEIIELKNDYCTAKIVVNIGNTLFQLSKNIDNKNQLYFPYSLEDYNISTKLAGNPFMHPWANRLEDDSILINNKKHYFPKNQQHLLYRDANNLPLHGLLLGSGNWKTIEIFNDENQCYHVAAYDFEDENMLQIFPFRHRILMKHILIGNNLEIETTIINLDNKPMPISFGFHPYFTKVKSDTLLQIPTDEVIAVNNKMIPTGNSFNKNIKWNFLNDDISLTNISFDDGFQNLKFINDKATFFVDDIKIEFDKQFSFAQIYAPNNITKPYVCIEPMTAPTNALNTNSCKKISKDETFTASFSIDLENQNTSF